MNSDIAPSLPSGYGRFTAQEQELLELTGKLLQSIHEGDLVTYTQLSMEDLSCYETDVAPYRVDGLDFHLELISAMQRIGTYNNLIRFDMLNPGVQIYGDCAIVTYTRLMTYAYDTGPAWSAFNETRVFVQKNESWKMAHFHRSSCATA